MSNNELKEIKFGGITMQIPLTWKYETESFIEEDGTVSYRISAGSTGKKVKNIDVSLGNIPEGSDSYLEACRTYEEILGEDPFEEEDSIVSFQFQQKEAHGFSVYTDDGLPCFFFCVDLPSMGKNMMLSVLVCASDDDSLEGLIDFVEEYIC